MRIHFPFFRRPSPSGKHWTALPNFVDCAVFRPVQSLDDKLALRAEIGIPEDAFVVGCVAAVKKHHKRVDYLIREFYQWVEAVDSRRLTVDGALRSADKPPTLCSPQSSDSPLSTVHRPPSTPYLLIAGAKTDETAELIVLAESLIPGRCKIMTDCSRARMPDLLRSMDVFVLTSLFEMMPIALLEALASGLPCVVNAHPVLEWMTGAGEDRGQWTVDGGRWTVDGGRWTVDGGRWTVDGGRWTVDSGLRTEGGDRSIEQKSQRSQREENGCVSSSLQVAADVPATALSVAEETSGVERFGNPVHRPLPTVHCFSSAGGMAIDMSQEGALAAALAALTPEWLAMHGRQARERAVKMFSTETVIGQYVKYYGEVMRNE